MAIRPSFKLEPSPDHELIEIEQVSKGIGIHIHDAGTIDDEPLGFLLTIEEATELAAMLRSVLGHSLSVEDAVILGLDDDAQVAV